MKKVFSTALALIMLVSMLFGTTAVSATTMPSCTGQRVSNVTTNSARVDFTIKNPSRLTVKTCGMQIRKKGTSKWTTKSETVASSYQKKNSIPGWYTIGKGKEVNFALSSGTTYEYRTFCKYGNKTYYAGVSSFSTKKSITNPSLKNLKSSSVTTSSARIDFTIKNPSCVTVKTCGMQIRKKGTSNWTTKSETVASSYQKKNSIPGWYTVGKGKEFNYTLSAGTTYEYRAFCIYSNKTFYSGVATFTTAKNTPAPKTPLEKLKKKYPEGTKSTNCFTYADNAFRYLNSRTAKQVKKGLNGKTAWNNIKVGDVIHYYKSKKDPDYKYGSQHWAYVVAKSSDSITLAEGNYKGKVHYGRKISKSKFVNKNFYNLEIRR